MRAKTAAKTAAVLAVGGVVGKLLWDEARRRGVDFSDWSGLSELGFDPGDVEDVQTALRDMLSTAGETGQALLDRASEMAPAVLEWVRDNLGVDIEFGAPGDGDGCCSDDCSGRGGGDDGSDSGVEDSVPDGGDGDGGETGGDEDPLPVAGREY